MSDKLGVLINGAGWVATQHIQAFIDNPHTEIVAISDIVLANAQKRADEAGLNVKCYDNYEAALNQPGIDIVSVCTPQHVHADNVLKAAAAGKHMVIEKPVCTSYEDMCRMRDAIRGAGVKTIVSFVLRWNPLFQRLKGMIANDDLGEVYCVETDYQSYSGDWWGGFSQARIKAYGVSAFLVGGCHAMDTLRWFAGRGEHEAADPVEVFGYAGGKRGDSTRQYNPITDTWHEGDPMEFPGLEMALVRFSNGVLGKVSTNFECIQPYTFPIEIFGDKGTARDNKVWSHRVPQQEWMELADIRPDSSDVSHHPFQGEIDDLVEAIRGDRRSRCDFDDAFKTHEVIFALQRCYETGRPVKLPL